MRNSGECVKCKGQHLWFVDKVHQPDCDGQTRAHPLLVTCHEVPGDAWNNYHRIPVGSFQVVICATCGYTEWYAYDIERLKDIPGARLVGPNAPNGGPYR
jgi:predicted nucleic-acid-binding Zn-ribbon protein